MGLLESIGFNVGRSTTKVDVGEVFEFAISRNEYVKLDMISFYKMILTDVLSMTQGLDDDKSSMLVKSYLANEVKIDALTLIAESMYLRTELFLVFDSTVVVRQATPEEQSRIRESYKDPTSPPVKNAVYVNFKEYKVTELLKVYSSMEYTALSKLDKDLNFSKALQVGIKGMRANVSLSDSSIAFKQGKDIVDGLRKGHDIIKDSEDTLTSGVPVLDPILKTFETVDKKKSLKTRLPMSYITGELSPGGLTDTGDGDARALHRGLRLHYITLFKPIIENLFDIKTSFEEPVKNANDGATQLLQTFNLDESGYLSEDEKRVIIRRAFNIQES